MMGVVGEARRSVESARDWIINEILRIQKPQLDQKIDEMLKPNRLRQKIKHLGSGFGIGKRLKRLGAGLSLRLNRLF